MDPESADLLDNRYAMECTLGRDIRSGTYNGSITVGADYGRAVPSSLEFTLPLAYSIDGPVGTYYPQAGGYSPFQAAVQDTHSIGGIKQGELFMVEVYPVIYDVDAATGSLGGGHALTITGLGFSSMKGDNQVRAIDNCQTVLDGFANRGSCRG